MPNGNKGLIGLPLKRVQSRNALVMSAIQEERSSVENLPLALPVATTTSSSSSCGTSPTMSLSSAGSSPTQSQPVPSHQPSPPAATKTTTSPWVRSRSAVPSEEVPRTATSPLVAPKSRLRVQSARQYIPAPMSGVRALRAVGSKVSQACSARTRSVPCLEASNTTMEVATTRQPQPPKKTTKAQSVRACPVTSFDDSFSNATTNKLRVNKEENETKTIMSLRSRPLPCFEDGLASSPTVQETKGSWKPRTVSTRPASSPTAWIPQSKSPAFLPSMLDKHATDAERSAPRQKTGLTSTPIVEERKPKCPKSIIDLTSTRAQQKCGHRPYLWEDKKSRTRKRASFDGSQGQKDTALGSDLGLRPRSLSDSASDLPLRKNTKPPPRLRHYEGKFQNRRGQSLLYFSLFPPKKMAMRGIVLHLHGMGDHCRRNTALYERHCKEGFGVITYDLLNHGESDYDKYNIRAHVSNFNDFIDDTNDFITFAKSRIYKVALRYWRKHHHPHGREKKRKTPPELPLIISGASFGSLLGIHTVLSGEHKFHAAVWASPSIGVMWTPVLWAQWKFARPLIAALPTAKVIPAIQHNLRSRDPEFLKKYQGDPLTCSDMITPRSGYQSVHAMMRLQREKRVFDAVSPFCGIPMLFLAGSEDRISNQQASIKFYSRMESLDKEFKVFQGLYHMIYEEPEKEDVFKYLVNWLHERFPLETRLTTEQQPR